MKRISKKLSIFLIMILILTSVTKTNKGFAEESKSEITEESMELEDRDKEDEETEDIIVNQKEENKGKKEKLNLKDGQNLIVLQIDSLQNFVLDLEYEGQEITPNINKLKNDNIFFKNYYEMTGIGDSGDAEFVSNNSVYPDRNYISYFKYQDNYFNGLPKILKSKDFKTYLMTNNERNRFNRYDSYVGQGYDKFYSEKDFSEGEKIGFSLNDGEYFKEALEKIKSVKKSEENIYLYMSNGSSQKPYNMEDNFKELDILNGDEGTVFDGYFKSMHYVDKQVGEFIEGLKSLGIYDETTLVIQSGGSGIPLNHKETKNRMEEIIGKTYDYEEMLNVPLIIRVPEDRKMEIETIGSHLDFMPTILGLMGIEIDSPAVLGENLMEFSGNRIISLDKFRARSFIKDDKTLLVSKDGTLEGSEVLTKGKNRYTPRSLEPDFNKFNKVLRDNKYILENDLIKEVENGFKIDENTDYSKLVDINNLTSINTFRQLYNEGYEYFRINIDNFRGFMSTLDEYSDIKYLINVSEDNYKKLEEVPKRYRDDMEIEILWNLENEILEDIKNMGYKHFVLNIHGGSIKSVDNSEYIGIIVDKENIESMVQSKEFEEIKKSNRLITRSDDSPISRQKKGQEIETKLKTSREVLDKVGKIHVPNKHLIAHAGGIIHGETYTNSVEALLESYETGLRLMEIDFDWTTDRQLAGTHDWKGVIPRFFNMPKGKYSLEEFKKFEMIHDLTPFTMNLVEKVFNQHPDMYLVTDVKFQNLEALEHMINDYPFLEGKIIPQVYSLLEYEEAKKLGYDEIILTLYIIRDSDDDIVEFAKKHRPFAVTMPVGKVREGLANRIRDLDIYTYTHTVNDLNLVEEMEDLGALGIYTDAIRP